MYPANLRGFKRAAFSERFRWFCIDINSVKGELNRQVILNLELSHCSSDAVRLNIYVYSTCFKRKLFFEFSNQFSLDKIGSVLQQ